MLVAENGKRIEVRLDRTGVGRAHVSGVGCDGTPWAEVQFTLVRDGVGWAVMPVPGTANATMINGRAVERKTPVKAGDVLAVGNAASGRFLTPLRIHLE